MMRGEFLFGRLERVRDQVRQAADKCPSDRRDTVPAGFNNNIHWHLGHIVTVTDNLMYGLSGRQSKLPASYKNSFGGGTKPADWTGDTPSWDEVVSLLQSQVQELKEAFGDQLDQALPNTENFLKAKTVGELFTGSIIHENTHYGSISAMLRVVGNA